MKKVISLFLAALMLVSAFSAGVSSFAVQAKSSSLESSFEAYSALTEEYDYQTQSNVNRLVVISKKTPDKLDSVEMLNCFGDYYLVQFENHERAKNALELYQTQSDIISAEYDSIVETETADEDEFDVSDAIGLGNGSLSWGSEAIGYNKSFISKFNLSALYALFLPKVTVGVIDSGINYNHSGFSSRVERTYFNSSGSGNENDEMDNFNHGTAVSGIIIDNTPNNVKIRAYKVTNSAGKSNVSNILYGIQQAVDDGVDILNISLGYEGSGLKQLIEEAFDNGVLTVTSAGNDAINASKKHPANVEKAITVASMKEDDSISSFSNYGEAIDIIAPGNNIQSYSLSGIQIFNGTSMSAAFVSAAAAIVKTKNQKAIPQEISDFLVINGRNINPPKNMYGAPALYLGSIQNFNMNSHPSVPVFSLESGRYKDSITLSLSNNNDSNIYYQIYDYNSSAKYTKLSAPVKYTDPIELNSKCNVAALSSKDYANNTSLKSDIDFRSYYFNYTNNEDNFEIDENGTITDYNGDENDVYVPDTVNGITVKAIGSSVFEVLRAEDINDEEKNFLRTIRLPDTCTTIGTNAFESCKYLTTVDAKNIQVINVNGFDDCASLENINLDKVISIGSSGLCGTKIRELKNDYLKGISKNAFSECKKLVSVDLPNVTTMGRYAFYGCESLVDVNMPKLELIDNYGFSGCYSLEHISLPSAESIANAGFYNCRSLKSVDILNVNDLADSAFHSCSLLEYLYLPKVLNIGKNVLIACNELKSVFMPKLETALSMPVSSKTTIYVSKELTSVINDNDAGYTIVAPQGSYAQAFAEENGHKFVDSNLLVNRLGRSIRVTDAGLRFGFNWNRLEEVDENAQHIEHGFVYSYSETEELDISNGRIKTANNVSYNIDKLSFNLVFTNIPKSAYEQVISARAYVNIDGMIFYSPILHGSFKEVANLVLADEDINQNTKDKLTRLLEA